VLQRQRLDNTTVAKVETQDITVQVQTGMMRMAEIVGVVTAVIMAETIGIVVEVAMVTVPMVAMVAVKVAVKVAE
jgi:hypothetical protein